VNNVPEAEQDLAFVRNLVDLTREHGEDIRFGLCDGVTAVGMRSASVLPGA